MQMVTFFVSSQIKGFRVVILMLYDLFRSVLFKYPTVSVTESLYITVNFVDGCKEHLFIP